MEEWRHNFGTTPEQNFSDSLLQHVYANIDFYLLLHRSGLSWLFHVSLKNACGLKADMPPALAYGISSIAGALFGWADEWFARGMKETPEELKQLAAQIQQPRP